jgi:hypothetical protein
MHELKLRHGSKDCATSLTHKSLRLQFTEHKCKNDEASPT